MQKPRITNLKDTLCIIASLLIAICAILIALPHDNEEFDFTYQVNEPWRYDKLIAPHEFPIHKSAAQRKAEEDSVLREFSPYFSINGSVAGQQVQNFRADYSKGDFPGIPYSYISHAVKLLQEVYEHGIVESGAYRRLEEASTKSIRIVNVNSASLKPVSEIYSTRTAYQYLMDNESNVYQRDLMVRLNLNNYLEPNLAYDSLRTESAKEEALAGITSTIGMVLGGERIIDRGDMVTERHFNILESLRIETQGDRSQSLRTMWIISIGQAGLVILLFTLLILYLQLFRKDLFENNRTIYLMSSLVTIFCVCCSIFVRWQLSVYIIPFAMVAIFIRVFMDTRTAFMVHTAMVISASLALRSNINQFVLIQMVAGLAAIYSLRDLTERAQLFKTAAYVTMVSWATALFYNMAQGLDFHQLDHHLFYYIALNGVVLLFAYPLMYIIERTFGFTSSVTLIELSNINAPILRRMSKEAQGTFVHSMQVGNLAAEVADKIGAKVQQVRTGALYHDIGKIINPAFFTENQSSVNPHDALSEERSAEIIINHVAEGLRLAEKHYLPKLIRDFILTHHGQSLVKYFYIKSCNKHGEDQVDKSLFTYPGKNPFTREQAILMMADSVEAASRSLKEYTEESIAGLVNGIIDAQVAAGYFKECPITFRDISEAKRVFIDSLKTIYHTRIAYPELNKTQEPATTPVQEPHTQRPRLFGSNNWKWR